MGCGTNKVKMFAQNAKAPRKANKTHSAAKPIESCFIWFCAAAMRKHTAQPASGAFAPCLWPPYSTTKADAKHIATIIAAQTKSAKQRAAVFAVSSKLPFFTVSCTAFTPLFASIRFPTVTLFYTKQRCLSSLLRLKGERQQKNTAA